MIRVPRKGLALNPSPLAGRDDVLGLNLAAGCAHRCAFCSARAYPSYPGDEAVYLYADTAEQVNLELSGRPRRPRAVYLCPSTDPFPPLAEVQAETARVVAVLARHGVQAWLMTRGYVRPAAREVLVAHRRHVKVTVALTTLDRGLQRLLEPLTAPPRLRLRQIRKLRELGVPVQAALEPLVPGLTDTPENLEPVLVALAAAGVTRVTAGYLFLRPRIAENLARALAPFGLDRPVLGAFTGGPFLASGAIAPARYLPKARRQRGYAALMHRAAGLGLTVCVSGLTNPDFRAARPAETAGPAVPGPLSAFAQSLRQPP